MAKIKVHYEYPMRCLSIDDITDDLSLNITDFCEPGDEEQNKLYWENLVENLQIKLGAS